MAKLQTQKLVKDVMVGAGTSLGAAFGGPLGSVLGSWTVHILGPAVAALLEESTEEFAKKAAEKIGEVGAGFLSEQLKEQLLQLEELYRDTLRRSLHALKNNPEFRDYQEWFVNWEHCFSQFTNHSW